MKTFELLHAVVMAQWYERFSVTQRRPVIGGWDGPSLHFCAILRRTLIVSSWSAMVRLSTLSPLCIITDLSFYVFTCVLLPIRVGFTPGLIASNLCRLLPYVPSHTPCFFLPLLHIPSHGIELDMNTNPFT